MPLIYILMFNHIKINIKGHDSDIFIYELGEHAREYRDD